jgi:hypothetical protein
MTMTQPEVLTEPYQIAPDVFVVPFQQFAPPVGFFCLNSMVVRGWEPMIVDTATPAGEPAGVAGWRVRPGGAGGRALGPVTPVLP